MFQSLAAFQGHKKYFLCEASECECFDIRNCSEKENDCICAYIKAYLLNLFPDV